MDWIPKIFRRRKLYDDLSEEIRLHIQERTEQLMREGMSPKEAERQARVAFGNQTLLEERSREVWQWPTLESIWADVRLAWRQLRRSPGFTIAAVLTLALAIGANAVVFGVLNALILRPLNVPHPQSLYTIERGGDKEQSTSYPDYLDLRDRNRSFDGLTAYILAPVGLDTGKNPSESWGYEVTGNYFDALGIQPYLGRFFHVADEHGPNSAPYLVISYAYWHSHFQDDRTVVGRVVQVNKHPLHHPRRSAARVQRNIAVLLSRLLGADGPAGTGAGAEGPEHARRTRPFHGAGACEGGSDTGTGDRGSELCWLVSREDLPQRRCLYDLFPGASKSRRRHAWGPGEGIHDGNDAAGRA